MNRLKNVKNLWFHLFICSFLYPYYILSIYYAHFAHFIFISFSINIFFSRLMQKTMQSKNRKKSKMKKWKNEMLCFCTTHNSAKWKNEKMKCFVSAQTRTGRGRREPPNFNWELRIRLTRSFGGATAARLWLRIERRWLEAITYSNRGQNPTGFRLRQQESATSWLEASTLGRVLRIMCWLPARGGVREEARVRNMVRSQLYNPNNLCWISTR